MKSSMFSSLFSNHRSKTKSSDEMDIITKCNDFNFAMIYLTNRLFDQDDDDDENKR